MKPIRRELFRAYDIRGVVDQDFDAEWVRVLGQAAGTFFLSKGWSRAVVGHDVRASSPSYQAALTSGLRETGVDVFVLGQVSTPIFYFAVRRLGLRAGLMVTASHNPPQYNGFKIWGGQTVLSPQAIAELYEVMAAGKFASGAGLASHHEVLAAYLDELAENMKLSRPVRVVVDGGNGTSGEITADLLARCGATVIRQYCEPDPAFPNHHPDPVVAENMGDLMVRVPTEEAELGIGLDGDGDRIGVVDETGRLVPGDELAAIFAREVLEREPGATILGDLKCSDRFFADVEKHGGNAIMGITGHSIMKAKMLQTGAAFGGELSGHMFFGGRFMGADDATWAALKLVHIIAEHPGKPISSYLADWPKAYATPEIHVPCAEAAKAAVILAVQNHFRIGAAQGKFRLIDLDGVRVIHEDGWALLRASNTQPVLVLRFEARTKERLREIRQQLEEVLESELARSGE